jgi:hypothetical protein
MSSWKEVAQAKRASIRAAIPQKWLLSHIPTVQEQKDITGKYIQQFLTEREIEITETDAVGIVAKTTTGAWKAREVTEAFCHRAALAHQLVSNFSDSPISPAPINFKTGQLSPRNILRGSNCRCTKARRLLRQAQCPNRSAPWPSYLSQRSIPCPRRRNYYGICGLDKYF